MNPYFWHRKGNSFTLSAIPFTRRSDAFLCVVAIVDDEFVVAIQVTILVVSSFHCEHMLYVIHDFQQHFVLLRLDFDYDNFVQSSGHQQILIQKRVFYALSPEYQYPSKGSLYPFTCSKNFQCFDTLIGGANKILKCKFKSMANR
uniref:Uncharacterized protein n=1 Tax=Glossina austeni TaxID=7395 RepID=A0A1A9VNG8_GLOAU